MDKTYADIVRLLLTVAPDVFRNPAFAMKGGTAINLFVHDMPRLSVDIDAVYTPWNVSRENALAAITTELTAIRERLTRLGLNTTTISSPDTGDRSLLISGNSGSVKIEVNVVFRGTVLPVQRRALVASAAHTFAMALELPVLAIDELYGSKLVAAMDRQHPRDLFDVWMMYNTRGLTDAAVECFVTYLAGHGRPIHEVLFGRQKDIALEYRSTFVGMATADIPLQTLMETRATLFKELPNRLTANQRQFLLGLARAAPDWSLLQCAHAANLSALQWKLLNIRKLQQTNQAKFEQQAQTLQHLLG